MLHMRRALFTALASAVCAACDVGPTPDATVAEYVGRIACSTCHVEQDQAWTGSHHDRAMQEPTEATVLGDFDNTTFEQLGVVSTFFKRDSTFFVETEGPTGALEAYEVAYTFGVEPLQQYLIEFPGGRYQALGIAWDSRPEAEGGQRWFHLYPDERVTPNDALHWTGREQNWNYQCAECHSTNVRKNFDLPSKSYATTWSEIDVSCEACHGPGSQHVALAKRVAADRESPPDSWAVALAVGEGGQWVRAADQQTAQRTEARAAADQVETCAHCHSRRSTIAEGRTAGTPFLDSDRPALMREGVYHPDGQILGEVYVYGSFIQSKMYRAGVTCTNCHDPHTLALRAPGNAVCSQCHAPAVFDAPSHDYHPLQAAGPACVDCHMPERTFMGVDPRRDHSLRIPRPDLTLVTGAPNACTACHRDQPAIWAANAVAAWYGSPADSVPHFSRAFHAAWEGGANAGGMLERVVRDRSESGFVRASALSALAPHLGAPGRLATVEVGIEDADPLVRLGALEALASSAPDVRLRLAYRLLSDPTRAIRIEAARLLASVPAEGLPGGAQDTLLAEGLTEYIDAQMVNADHPSAHLNLGQLWAQRGDAARSEVAAREALALDSMSVPAYTNLADLLRAQGRDSDVEEVLSEGLRHVPDDPALLHAMGLLRVREGLVAEAIPMLQRAAAGAPEVARFSYVLGVAFNSTGDERAIGVLESALELHPTDIDILQALAVFHRDSGRIANALTYAERLAGLMPSDPGVQGLVAQLLAMGR